MAPDSKLPADGLTELSGLGYVTPVPNWTLPAALAMVWQDVGIRMLKS